MGSRIVLRNRVAMVGRGPGQIAHVSDSARAAGALPLSRRDKDGNATLVDTTAIPADSPESPFRAGLPWRCPDDGLTYRVVEKLDVQAGWGTAAFWMARYGITDFKFIREWVERGWLDAAREKSIPTKRYRCRDERKIYNVLLALHDTKNSVGPGTKTKIRMALLKLRPLFEVIT